MSVEFKKGEEHVHEMRADYGGGAEWVWCRVTAEELNNDMSRRKQSMDTKTMAGGTENMTICYKLWNLYSDL